MDEEKREKEKMIIAIDTETGGTNPATDALLSISACHFEDPKKVFTVFIQPEAGLNINAEAAAVNGYTPERWKERGAVPIMEALRRLKAWLPYSGNTPLAHNASFDRQFIEAAERRTAFKLYLKYHWHCSMTTFFFSNIIFDLGAPNFQLVTLAKMSGHWPEDFDRGQHQSADDVVACAVGYKWLMSKGLELRQQVQLLTAENLLLRKQIKEKEWPSVPTAADYDGGPI